MPFRASDRCSAGQTIDRAAGYPRTVLRWRAPDLGEASFLDFLRSLPYVAVAGFVLGFIGSWVKPVESVDSVVDRLEFGAVCAGFYLVMMPLVFGIKKWWDWMWSRAGF